MGAAAASATSAFPRKAIGYARVSRACAAPKPGDAACYALVRIPVPSAAADEPGVRPYEAAAGALESGPAGGLTPAELASAYGYSSAVGGSGQTIAIVDAYDDPSIESDLATFDAQYGIAECTKANGCFTKVSQTGSTVSLPAADPSGWSVEISLDVEVAHSTCPNCKILLVEANTPEFHNLATAVNEAVALGATEVSNSYGGPESPLGTTEKEAYSHPGVVIAAATGDNGYYDWTKADEGKHLFEFHKRLSELPERPNMPASIPSVVAVGGTTLDLDSAGRREDETVWNGDGQFDESYLEYGLAEGATGGGCSALFIAEPWQQDAPGFAAAGCGSKRLAADVSADADPYTGFDIYDSYECGEACTRFKGGRDWLTIGGTSLSTPLISSLYALAGGSGGVSYPSLTLYGHLGDSSDLYDVTEGSNGFCDEGGLSCGADELYGVDVDCEGTTACNAGTGFDGPSGVGTPNSLGLFTPQLPTAAIASPSSIVSGVPASFNGAGSSDPYPNGTISSYSWSWGDGTPDSTGVTPTHTYTAPGEYAVTLTVTDAYGVTSGAVTRSVDVVRSQAEIQAEEAALNKKHEEELASAKSGVSAFENRVPEAQLAGTSLQVSASGTVKLKISCPAGESSCTGTVTLRTLSAVIAANGRAAKHKPTVLTLATGSFSVAGGVVRAVTLHLSQKARVLLARVHTLRARATLLAHDLQDASHTTTTIVTLRAAKPHHKG
jgi:subtilase family serine protease